MQTVRTTIRIRKDLFDQSRRIAFERNMSLQDVINTMLAKGLHQISDTNQNKKALDAIDKLREKLQKQGRKIDVDQLIQTNKRELQQRTDMLFDNYLEK